MELCNIQILCNGSFSPLSCKWIMEMEAPTGSEADHCSNQLSLRLGDGLTKTSLGMSGITTPPNSRKSPSRARHLWTQCSWMPEMNHCLYCTFPCTVPVDLNVCLIIAWIPFPYVNIFAMKQYTVLHLKSYKLAGCYYKRLLNCRLLLYIWISVAY